jgi:hypothetical protein
VVRAPGPTMTSILLDGVARARRGNPTIMSIACGAGHRAVAPANRSTRLLVPPLGSRIVGGVASVVADRASSSRSAIHGLHGDECRRTSRGMKFADGAGECLRSTRSTRQFSLAWRKKSCHGTGRPVHSRCTFCESRRRIPE